MPWRCTFEITAGCSYAMQFHLKTLVFIILPISALLATIMGGVLSFVGVIKPPRPAFCNEYGYYMRGQWWPRWHPTHRRTDSAGSVSWIDIADNSILIVLPTDDRHLRECHVSIEVQDQATFRVSDRHSNETVTVQRSPNRLILVNDRNHVKMFPIRRDCAMDFYIASTIGSVDEAPLVDVVLDFVDESHIDSVRDFGGHVGNNATEDGL